MTGSEGAKKEDTQTISVGFMPQGHMIVGYIAYVKVMDQEGDYYWASRDDGLNSMEMLGMAHDMVSEYTQDLASSRREPGDG